MSQRGTRQGDVLGAFLFALVIHPVLVEAKETYGLEVDIMAYLDDITLIGDNPVYVKACVELIEQRFRTLGLELNASKCEWFSTTVACPFSTWQTISSTPIKILGAFHSPSGGAWEEQTAQTLLKHTVAKHATFFERLQKLQSNIALVLLGACGIPRMNFAIRVHAPEIAKESSAWFDKQVETTIEDMACIKLDKDSRALISLPTALGGCGLTNIEEISPLAYKASLSQIGPKEQRLSQEELTLAHNLEKAKILRESSPQMAMHLDDCKGDGNSRWMHTVEDVPLMSNEITGAAVRTRLKRWLW